MDIPNGLTLSLQNTRYVTRKIGNGVLNGTETEQIHIRTVRELLELITLRKAGEIRIYTKIPDSVMDLIGLPHEDEPKEVPKGGVVYQDQLAEMKKELLAAIGTGSGAPQKPKLDGPRNENTIFERFEVGGFDMLRLPGFEFVVDETTLSNPERRQPVSAPYLGELKGFNIKLKPAYREGAMQFNILQGNTFLRSYGLHGMPLEGGEYMPDLDAVFSEAGELIDTEMIFPIPPNGIFEIIWMPRTPGPDDVDMGTGEVNTDFVKLMKMYGLGFDLNDGGGLLEYAYVTESNWNGEVTVEFKNGDTRKVKEAYHVDAEGGDFVLMVAGIIMAILQKREITHT